ncbi:MAG: hypothetical protein JWL84_3754 [Rhodospirillales bacterium]|jgi:hypothetical protein|nr:hypothetical protein [Rhodospirillales bacterium]
MKARAGAGLVISNKSDRDVPIARSKERRLGVVRNALVDADVLDIPLLRSYLPE